MNHGREKGKREKPIKKRPEGYTGERKKRLKEEALNKAKLKSDNSMCKFNQSIRPIGLQIRKSDEELNEFRRKFVEEFKKSLKKGNCNEKILEENN